MRVSIRIVAGSLKGRRITCNHGPELRPTPQMVREAMFSILGNAIPERPFVDIFAGTGVVGLEALSRGASQALFVERDLRLAQDIEINLRTFGLQKRSRFYRTDSYRWIAAWRPPAEPANVFISPPFDDLKERPEEMVKALATLQENVAIESVLILQGERGTPLDDDSALIGWERRRYGRNVLFIWQKE